ncbi:MAG TPA: polymer-forming cytoskeletal protein [Actinomycetota bacterium]|jgi:cytoskeletal protein CcmA (bactofilin family)
MFRRNEDDRDGPIQPKEVQVSNGGSEVTVVGQGARLEGTVVSAGSLRVDGQVKGKITADGDVTLSPQSKVEADIHATNVTVAGTFTGNIVAKGRAELARGGRVIGNVTSKTLVVSEGAVFSGQSVMGEQPAAATQPSASAAASAKPAQAGQPAAAKPAETARA